MQQSLRDNFSADTKRQLASSVGTACSICGRATHGPNDNFSGAINNGVAAHITAASPGGPRYDPNMTEEERKNFSNGIWVCPTHGSLIDKLPLEFSVADLQAYKLRAMQEQKRKLFEIIQNVVVNYQSRDALVLEKYATILPYNYLQELSNEPFGAYVSHSITDPLYKVLDAIDDPSYIFADQSLECVRNDLNVAVRDFFRHFGGQSAGLPNCYEYINIPQFKARNPNTDERYWELYIEETHRLAMVICDIAYLMLMKKEGLR